MKPTALPCTKHYQYPRIVRRLITHSGNLLDAQLFFHGECLLSCGEFPAYIPYSLSHSCLLSLFFSGCLYTYLIYPCIARSFHYLLFFNTPIATENSVSHIDISYSYDLDHSLLGSKNNLLETEFQYGIARIDYNTVKFLYCVILNNYTPCNLFN